MIKSENNNFASQRGVLTGKSSKVRGFPQRLRDMYYTLHSQGTGYSWAPGSAKRPLTGALFSGLFVATWGP